MLGQRLRRWPNILPTLGERLVLAGLVKKVHSIPTVKFYAIFNSKYNIQKIPCGNKCDDGAYRVNNVFIVWNTDVQSQKAVSGHL